MKDTKADRGRQWWSHAVVLFLSFVVSLTAIAAPVVRELDGPTRIEVSSALPPEGIDDASFLAVALLDDTTGQPGAPIFGTHARVGTQLVFRPHFALAPGARYRINAGGETLVHQVPKLAPHAAASVESVRPACAEVPANLLKFYLHFSRPMREGREVFSHIELLDESGESIGAPWRDTELWTDDARRLTLWIHPGRVKRGVNLREELGPVLRPGARYTLVVGAGLRDASGQPLGREFRHSFRTAPETHDLLDLAPWTIDPPKAGTREPLHVLAATPLDHALASRCLHVRDSQGTELPGMAALADDARTWTFTPRDAWSAERYELAADPQLEDLAGNNFTRVFDDDVTLAHPTTAPALSRAFSPR